MKITPATLSISQLLGAPNEQYVIPAYQRRYSWHEKQLNELLDDIKLLEPADAHLLGSIVCLTVAHTAGLNRLELVDGQQRLTTVSILLRCIHDRLKELGRQEDLQEVSRLLVAKAHGVPGEPKIALDSLDAKSFATLVRSEDDASNPDLRRAFQICRDWARNKDAEGVSKFLYQLSNQAFVIRLDVSEAKDAFKLFETINNRGLRLSATDIIKNFLLGNAARFGEESLELARSKWADVIAHLDGVNSETFLRHFLSARLRRRMTQSYVISTFKKVFMSDVAEASSLPDRHWYLDEEVEDEIEDDVIEGEEPEEPEAEGEAEAEAPLKEVSFSAFLEELVSSAATYSRIVQGRTGDVAIDRRLRNLNLIRAMQTYGFLMHLRLGRCSDKNFERVLALTEAFLLRRHVCRMRSNETDTAFARLCGTNPQDPLAEVTSVYRQYSPSDERFAQEFATTPFIPRLLERARYCLEQFEGRRQGQHVELLVGGPSDVHVEHIIPQKIRTKKAKEYFGEWVDYLGPGAEANHPKYVARIGNLSLFAGPLNIGASNNPYERKKVAYLKSAIKIANTLPAEFPEFRFEQVEARSAQLAAEAVKLWPIP